jgi:hypothetical protein
MDVLTPKGRITLEQERRAAALFEQAHPGCRYLPTPKDQPARVDAVIVRGDRIVAVAETKCREATAETFFGSFGGEWLVTFDKLLEGRAVAIALGVRFIGLLYLVPDDRLLVTRLFNADGSAAAEFSVRNSVT